MNILVFTSRHNSLNQRLLIEQAVERLDIEVLLDPNMPHLGSMEVLARIKQDLCRNLHSVAPVKAA